MKLGAFAEAKKPEKGANDKYDYGVGEENPVEDNETN
jgi:hypothetical protein